MSTPSGTILAQGRAGHITVASSALSIADTPWPVYQWAISAPRNRVTGDPVGNTASTNYAEGAITSRLTASMMVAKTGSTANTASVLDQTNGILQYFIQRAFDADSGMDDTIPFQIKSSDGNSLYTLANCKPESFVLRIRPGGPVGLDMVFVSPGRPTRTDGRATTLPYIYNHYVTDNAFKLLMWNDIAFSVSSTGPTGSFTEYDGIYGLDCSYANNHISNFPIRSSGALDILSFDAGRMSGGCDITLRAYSGDDGDTQPLDGGVSIKTTIALTVGSQIMTLPQVVTNSDLDGSGNAGPSFRTWRTLLLGSVTGGKFYQPVTMGTAIGIN